MKRVLLLAASALMLTAFVPEQADAQGRRFGVRGGVVRGPVIAGRGPVYDYPRGYYGPGLGAAVGLGILGGAALGAAAAAPLLRLRRRPLPASAAGHRRVGQCPLDLCPRVLELDSAIPVSGTFAARTGLSCGGQAMRIVLAAVLAGSLGASHITLAQAQTTPAPSTAPSPAPSPAAPPAGATTAPASPST